MDGRNIWTVGMDRWTARRDGQDRWEYGMNHVDGKDEEEIDDEIFSFSCFFLFFFFSICLSGFIFVHLTLTLFHILQIIFESPHHLTP